MLKIAVVVSSIFVSSTVFGCGVSWVMPANHFDGCNEYGELSYWNEIEHIDAGNGLNIPLIVGFNPTRGRSPYLGRGWTIPFLESRVVQIDERKFLLTQPDGVTRRFWRKNPSDSILQGQGGWKGEIRDDSITLWADCGWKLTYSKGNITTITTPQNRILYFDYTQGSVCSVREQGRVILTVNRDQSSGLVSSIDFNSKRIQIAQDKKPIIDVSTQGIKLVKGFENSLHKLLLPSGDSMQFDFAVDEELNPTLKISGNSSRNFTWNPSSGEILKDGPWNYSIGAGKDRFTNANIQRTSDQQLESWFLDRDSGQETTKKDGLTLVRKFFVSGPLEGKTRSIILRDNSGKETSIYSSSYDETGRLMRYTLNGKTTILDYHNNELTAVTTNGLVCWEKRLDNQGRVKSIGTPGKFMKTFDYSEDGKKIVTTQTPAMILKASYDEHGHLSDLALK